MWKLKIEKKGEKLFNFNFFAIGGTYVITNFSAVEFCILQHESYDDDDDKCNGIIALKTTIVLISHALALIFLFWR